MNFTNYIKNNKILWLCLGIFLFLVQHTILFGNTLGIDTEDIIHLQEDFYKGWLTTGRQGLVLIKCIADSLMFNPVFSGICTYLLLLSGCVLWTYLFEYVSGRNNKYGKIFFSLIILSSPILTEQFYFKLQSPEISLCFLFIAFSLYNSYIFARDKNIICFMMAVPPMAIAFCSYQVMVALFLFGATAIYLLYYIFEITNGSQKTMLSTLWFFILRFASPFFVSFIINHIITVKFFSGSSYLSNQVMWYSQTFKDCIFNILSHIKDVILGTWIYYPKTFFLYAVSIFFLTILLLFNSKKQPGKILCVLDIILLFMSPFYMTMVCGGQPVIRSQLVMPFELGFMAYVIFGIAEQFKIYEAKTKISTLLQNRRTNRLLRYLFVACGVLTCYIQVQYSSMLNYSEQIRYESDVRIAGDIIQSINKLQNKDFSIPVVFVGRHSAELNNSCIIGESIGRSFFEWDTNVEPLGYYSTRRILGFMHSLGVDYTQAGIKDTKSAIKISSDMPDYPLSGSIKRIKDVIIVKLSSYN